MNSAHLGSSRLWPQCSHWGFFSLFLTWWPTFIHLLWPIQLNSINVAFIIIHSRLLLHFRRNFFLGDTCGWCPHMRDSMRQPSWLITWGPWVSRLIHSPFLVLLTPEVLLKSSFKGQEVVASTDALLLKVQSWYPQCHLDLRSLAEGQTSSSSNVVSSSLNSRSPSHQRHYYHRPLFTAKFKHLIFIHFYEHALEASNTTIRHPYQHHLPLSSHECLWYWVCQACENDPGKSCMKCLMIIP